ncbi:MAG: TlpA family protein disulfide reductase [Epsilonproteobacteria bacterium]|nr:TlpA family protein disulfide reductase [Campylobacterota bacterium]
MLKKFFYSLLFSSVLLLAADSAEENQTKIILNKLNMQDDKVYLIDFFASWCKSCKKELPLISKVHNAKLVEVIGINVDKKREDGEAFVKELELPFRVIYDEDKSFIEAFDPMGFPAMYYMKNGKILNVVFGAVDSVDKKIADDLKELQE